MTDASGPGIRDAGSPQRYELVTSGTSRRLFLRANDQGVTLANGRILWEAGGRSEERPLDEVRSVHLSSQNVAGGSTGICALRFADGTLLNVMSMTAWGYPDEARADAYRAFVADLHGWFVAKNWRGIDFHAGHSADRQAVATVALVAATLLLVVVPAIVLLATGQPKLLSALFVAAGLVWPAWKSLRRNKPTGYTPDSVPNAVLP